MERWKIEYNIRCYEIATLMMKYEFDINRVDRILSKVYKESVENSVNSGIIEERGWITKNGRRIYIGEDSRGSSGGSSGGVRKGSKRLEDIQIGRSVGAKARNYDVMDLATGEKYHFAEGTRLQNVEVFAGKGTRTVFRKAGDYAERYGGKAKDWQHCKGFGVLDTSDGDREAEVHWVQCQGIGKYEFFIKRWLD